MSDAPVNESLTGDVVGGDATTQKGMVMSLGQQLKEQTAAVKFRKHVFRIRKRLSDSARETAANTFNTTPDFIAASKKLLETDDPNYKQVITTIRRARSYWKSMTIGYPVRGIRLIRKDQVETFEQQMNVFKAELETHISAMCDRYTELKQASQQKLGSLFSPSDYPGVQDFRDEFSIKWEFPNVEPPNELAQLNPALYEQERARVAARFEEAMAGVEQALATEVRGLLEHLCDKLTPSGGKSRKALSAKAVAGLTEFVDRFKTLHVGGNSDLDAIVQQVESLTKGLDPDAIKKDPSQQTGLYDTMTTLRESLDNLIVDAPSRKITLPDEDDA